MSVIGSSAVSEYDEEDGPQIGDDLMVRSGGEGEEGEERVYMEYLYCCSGYQKVSGEGDGLKDRWILLCFPVFSLDMFSLHVVSS